MAEFLKKSAIALYFQHSNFVKNYYTTKYDKNCAKGNSENREKY